MKKEEIMKSVTSTFNKAKFNLKKRSPEILIVAGVVGTVASAVMACRATMKLSEVLEESKDDISKIHEYSEKPEIGDKYTKDNAKKDLTIVYAQAGIKVAKLYAPSVALGALSLTSIIASNNILRKRNVALAAAYATVDKTFKEYRSRVVERFGEEVDKELKCNIKAKKIEETVTDPETGKEKKVKSTINVADPNENEYARFFDETCLGYEKDYDYNLMFLRSQQQYANDKLRADGSIFLSDIYDELGIKNTKLSRSVGWLYNPDGNKNGDNFVDFGITETNRETEDGYEKAILLNFNVDGPILDLI